jgi:hypothetical protein
MLMEDQKCTLEMAMEIIAINEISKCMLVIILYLKVRSLNRQLLGL